MNNYPLVPPEPDALSPEYHKARRQVMLWSGILLAWDVLGVDLELAKSAEGNVGPIISSIKNPSAVTIDCRKGKLLSFPLNQYPPEKFFTVEGRSILSIWGA